MSGDADTGRGYFTDTGSNLTVSSSSSVYASVPFFFVTNTNATISLTNTKATYSSSQYFISAKGTSEWGKSGSNGGNVTLSTTGVTKSSTDNYTDNISSITGS